MFICYVDTLYSLLLPYNCRLTSIYNGCALLFVLRGFISEHNKFPSLSLYLFLFLPFSLAPLDAVPCTNTATQRDTGCESYITTTGKLLPLGSCATCMET